MILFHWFRLFVDVFGDYWVNMWQQPSLYWNFSIKFSTSVKASLFLPSTEWRWSVLSSLSWKCKSTEVKISDEVLLEDWKEALLVLFRMFSCNKMRERSTLIVLGVKRHRRQRGEAGSGTGVEMSYPSRPPSSWRIAESFALRHLEACAAEICKPIE